MCLCSVNAPDLSEQVNNKTSPETENRFKRRAYTQQQHQKRPSVIITSRSPSCRIINWLLSENAHSTNRWRERARVRSIINIWHMCTHPAHMDGRNNCAECRRRPPITEHTRDTMQAQALARVLAKTSDNSINLLITIYYLVRCAAAGCPASSNSMHTYAHTHSLYILQIY